MREKVGSRLIEFITLNQQSTHTIPRRHAGGCTLERTHTLTQPLPRRHMVAIYQPLLSYIATWGRCDPPPSLSASK